MPHNSTPPIKWNNTMRIESAKSNPTYIVMENKTITANSLQSKTITKLIEKLKWGTLEMLPEYIYSYIYSKK